MPADVTLVTGPVRSGKTARLVTIAAAELARGRDSGLLGTALWLAPNFRAVDGIRQRLLATGQLAVLGLGIRTFDQFADALLGGAIEAGRPLSRLQKRRLLGQVLEGLHDDGNLTFFAGLAERSSVVDTVGRTITELKRRGISAPALAKRAQRAGASARDRDMARIYAEYQQRLDAHRLYDVDSRLAVASELVRRGEVGAFADLRLICVDGLTTFTPAQLELLRAWAERIEQIAISLTFDEGADRPELFATTRATLEELCERFENVRIETPGVSRVVPPAAHENCSEALGYLRQRLFSNPRKAPSAFRRVPSGWLSAFEIIAAASQQDEVVQVARRIKQLLVKGVAANDILVTARSLAGLAPRIDDVFPRFGIPLAMERWRNLGEDPLVRALIALLELDAGDWPFRKLVRVLTNRRITVWDHDHRRGAAEWIVRERQYANGRAALLKAINSSLAVPPSGGDGSDGPPDGGTMNAAAASLLNDLAAAIDSLPEQATPLGWFAALERFAKRLGIVSENAETVKELRRALRGTEQLVTWQGQPPPQLDRGAVLKLLRDVASHERLPDGVDGAGCVRVVSAPTARLLPAKHLFLMGMVEQSFPPPEPLGELYNDRELDSLAGVRRDDEDCANSASREMLLFYEIVSCPTEGIVFSYAALDEKAQPQFASPYLQEVQRLFGPGAIRTTQPQASMRPVPNGPAASDADWRLQAVDQALKGNAPLLAGLATELRTASTAQALLAGLAATHHRTRGDSFGPFEGVLAAGPAHRKLAQRFDAEHLWSPSQLERYAQCPFRFMMEHVCRFKPPGELLLDTDRRRKGTLAHEALSLLHRRLQARIDASMTVSHLGADTLREEYIAALHEARQRLPQDGVIGALADIEREEIERWAQAYATQHGAYDKQWANLEAPMRPSHFEVRFGPARGNPDGEGERSTDDPFVLTIGDEELRFTGRIDRIDVGRMNGQTVLAIVDYKSGDMVKYATEDVETGKQLQLVLYALAAEQHLFRGEGARAIQAGYWALADDKLQTRSTQRWVDFHQVVEGDYVPSEGWSKTWEATGKRIADMVRGIRHGEFPMHNTDQECTSTCDFKTICRVAVARSLKKVWPGEKREPLMDANETLMEGD